MARTALAAQDWVGTEADWTWQPEILVCFGNKDACHFASVVLPLQLLGGDVGSVLI
jgi:hypothetical protein